MDLTASQSWLQLMQKGQACFQRGHLTDATQFFHLATCLAPKKVEAWVNLGVSQVESGDFSDALISLQQAIDLNPSIMPAQMAMGDAHRGVGNWDEATSSYRRALLIQRTPLILNKLASSLRIIRQYAVSESLYHEALRMDPNSTLVKVNLATLQVELGRYQQAKEQLRLLEKLPLSPEESYEVHSTNIALDLYIQLQSPLETLLQKGDNKPLYQSLQAIPENLLQVDEQILEFIDLYADSARKLSLPTRVDSSLLPDDWPLIESLFMIPLVESVNEYIALKTSLSSGITDTSNDLTASVNMKSATDAARAAQNEMTDPIKADMHLRHWHGLAMSGVENMLPGQFKINRNLVRKNVGQRRGQPHLVTGTWRRFITEVYNKLPPGLPRGLVTLMAIFDIHPFSDGNGRIGRMLLNRELEWTGQMPLLVSRDSGLHKKLGDAVRAVRNNGGDISLLIPIVIEGQHYAQQFCHELNHSK